MDEQIDAEIKCYIEQEFNRLCAFPDYLSAELKMTFGEQDIIIWVSNRKMTGSINLWESYNNKEGWGRPGLAIDCFVKNELPEIPDPHEVIQFNKLVFDLSASVLLYLDERTGDDTEKLH